MPDSALSLDAGMQQIRQRFLARLEDRLELIGALQSDGAEAVPNAEEIRMEVHKIAGSAQSFGFPELSAPAFEIEHGLDEILAGRPAPAVLARIRPAVDGLFDSAVALCSGIAEAPEEAIDPAPPAADAPAGHRILIVDDDDLLRALLSQSFAAVDTQVIEAGTGPAALAFFDRVKAGRSEAPDLALVDLNLPGMSGFELLEALKSDPALADLPVIMLTRSDHDAHVIHGLSNGAIDYVSKPFHAPSLVRDILSILERRESRILIADDDDLVCALLRQRFLRLGHRVVICHDGVEALKHLLRDRPRIAILDVMMPGMDGIAVLRRAKADPATRDIPIILLTAKRQHRNILKGLEAGAHDYIAKPFDIDELAFRVSAILRREAAR